MNEIKCRVWDEETRSMLDIHEGSNFEVEVNAHGVLIFMRKNKPIKGVIMLYTGLKDRNSKEICDGDILKAYIPNTTLTPTEIISPIIFKEGCFIHFKMNNSAMLVKDVITLSNSPACNFSGVEILGNVYENPELLNN